MVWDCHLVLCKSFILIFRINGFSFWVGETEKNEYESWNCGWHGESNMFWDCRSYSTRVLHSCPRLMLIILKRWDRVWILKILWNWEIQHLLKLSLSLLHGFYTLSNSDFSTMGYCRKRVYEVWCGKDCEDCESSLFCWDSSMTCTASYSFLIQIFSSIGCCNPRSLMYVSRCKYSI